jgi:signal transduction histidine kinase
MPEAHKPPAFHPPAPPATPARADGPRGESGVKTTGGEAPEAREAGAARARLLAEASRVFAEMPLDRPAVLEHLVGLVAEALDGGAAVVLPAPNGQTLDTAALHHPDRDAGDLVRRVLAATPLRPGEGVAGRVYSTGMPALIPTVDPERLRPTLPPEHQPALDRIGTRSLCAVPLRTRGQVAGVLLGWRTRPDHPYTMDDQRLLQELADRAAQSVENARLYALERRAADRAARLHDLSAALARSLSPAEVAREVVTQAIAAMGARVGAVLALVEGGTILEVLHQQGYGSETRTAQRLMRAWRRFPVSLPTPAGDAVRTGESVLMEDSRAREARYPHLSEVRDAVGEGAVAALPLVANGRPLGALHLGFAASRAFLPDDRAFMRTLAGDCAQALDRVRLYEAERAARAQAEAARRLAEAAQGRLAFLAEAGAALASSLGYETTLQQVADLAVPRLADWCVVDVAREDGALTRVAIAHADPARRAAAERLRREYPAIAPDETHTAARVAATGRPWVDAHVSPERLVAEARDPQHLELVRTLGFGAELVVPLVARERVLGTITLVSETQGRYGDPADLQFAEALARRCALAVDNARLYRQAQDAVRARDEFLSIAAHELRTPVTAIKGLAQLMQRFRARARLDDARLERTLAQMVESSNRLAALTEDLLDVARLQSGHLELRPQVLSPGGFVRGLVEAFAAQTDERHPLDVAMEDTGPVHADPARLEQVLDNLLTNAVKYSPDGGTITVAVRSDGAGALIEVQDRGIGLPPGAETAIFEPFGRAPNAAARHIPGLGLGLYLCRHILELHGGRIWAESPGEGLGTTVRVWLPTDSAEEGATHRPQAPAAR